MLWGVSPRQTKGISRSKHLTQGKGKDANEGLEADQEEGPDKGDVFGSGRGRQSISMFVSFAMQNRARFVSHIEAPKKRDGHLGICRSGLLHWRCIPSTRCYFTCLKVRMKLWLLRMHS